MRPLLTRRHRSARLLSGALLLAFTIVAVLFWRLDRTDDPAKTAALPLEPTPRYDELASTRSLDVGDPEQVDLGSVEVPLQVELARGQTMGQLLGDLGLDPGEVQEAVMALGEHLDMRRLRAGQDCLAYMDQGARLARLHMRQPEKGWVELARAGDGWRCSLRPFERRVQKVRVAGRLDDFLERAIRQAGGAPELAYRMAEVLQWDLDFNRDLRVGDRFQVLYEEVYLDGVFEGVGRILALNYENAGRLSEAYMWGEAAGYYDGEGRPLRKLFLRSPLRFSRISSRFSMNRMHPVLRVRRPHYGVDYAAPTGTPVRATANGVVTFAGRSGGAGKMVKVRHSNGYLTAYLHLSRYAKGLRSGRRVKQGDVIGFVGSTGLSTGPHLDYRVQKNGRWIDPLTIKSVPAEPVPHSDLDAFLRWRDSLRKSLASGEPPPLPPEGGKLAGGAAGTVSSRSTR